MNEKNDCSRLVENKPVNEEIVTEVSVDKVRIAVNGIKNGKALRPGGISAELLKFLRMEGWTWLALFFYKLLLKEARLDLTTSLTLHWYQFSKRKVMC